MSSSTSRLGLTKLADGENFSNTILNQNWDKVDDLPVPIRPIVKTITATSQSDLDTKLATECASLGYGKFEVIELYANWTGSPTTGVRSLCTLFRINVTGNYYEAFLHYSGVSGYYYSGEWHWLPGIPQLTNQFVANQPYTPDITSASTGFTVANKIFTYARAGNIVLINGRFEITSIGNDATKTFAISLPTGMETYDRVGACGFFSVGKTLSDYSKLSLRQGVNNIFAQVGAGGEGVLSIIGTGYVMMNAVIMIK